MRSFKPDQDKEFEIMIREFISREYSAFRGHFTLYGSNGQRQYGCDIKDQAGKLIVQCKCYNDYFPKAREKLERAVRKNYEQACRHFPEMEVFVVCTTLSRHSDLEDKLKAIQGNYGGNTPINVFFWEDIVERTHFSKTANGSYADHFEKTLFLSEGNPNTCLKNLFVSQKYREIRGSYDNNEVFDDLYDRIARFTADKKHSLMIIEGDAGCGKTSLVESICYHDREGDIIAKKTLGGRPLVAVKLRDLNKKLFTKEDGLMPALAKYLDLDSSIHISDLPEALNERFPNALLVLDGFDELCIMDGISDYAWLLYTLPYETLRGWKFIIVSRPNYIRRNIKISHVSIALEHFDKEKRIEWMKNYTAPERCGGTIDTSLQQFILENTEEGLCDTPLTLYLLAAGGVEEKDRNNLWRLYHQIFSKEITKRRYSGRHPGSIYSEASYQLAELVAHAIYQTGNERLFIDGEQLKEIASKLSGQSIDESRAIAEHCLALSCYWKVGERGMAEFYHNNIRDFFLCEMIWRGVSDIYSNGKLSKNEKCGKLIAFFRDNFRRGELEPKVLEFIRLKAEAYKEDGNSGFPACEGELKLLPEFFEEMISDGRIYNDLNEENLLRAIASSFHCVMGFYHGATIPFLTDGEYLLWYRDYHMVDASLLLRTSLLELLSPQRIDFSYDSFADINLQGVSLMDASLAHTDLTRTDLTGAFLTRADLTCSVLQSASLTYTYLADAKLNHADLTYADLFLANMTNADLTGANLSCAKLSSATLPDGFRSDDQDEQVAHLKSMKIEGLII